MKTLPMYKFSLPLLALLAASCTHVSDPDSVNAPSGMTEYEARQAHRVELTETLAAATAPGADASKFQTLETTQGKQLSQPMPRSERLYLIRMLGLFGDETSVEVLTPLLSDDDPAVRDGARRALSVISGPTATAALEAGLQSEDPLDHAGTIDALAYSQVTDAARAISQSLQSSDSALVTSAALALGKLGHTDGVPTLEDALESAPAELIPLLEATLLTLDLDEDAVARLAASGSNPAIRSAAFQKLNTLDPGRAEAVLKASLLDPDFEGRGRMLSYTLANGSGEAVGLIIDHLPNAPLSDQLVILAAIGENEFSDYEPQVLALVPSAERDLYAAVIETLSRIGGDASFEPVYQAYAEDPDDRRFSEALSRLRAPSADAKVLAAVRNGSDVDAQIAAMAVLGLRNTPGATELLNGIAVEPGDPELREAAFKALETIGNLESVQILANLILVRDPQARPAQRSLWRLSMNYGAAEELWNLVYEPAIQSAPDDEIRASFVYILDGIACDPTLDYLGVILAESQSELHSAAIGALKRWPEWEASSVWVQVASAPGASAGDINTAERVITHQLTTDEWKNAGEKIDLAVRAIQQAPNPEFKQAIIDCYQTPTDKQRRFIKTAFPAIENDPDVGPQVARILGDDATG